MIDPIHAEISFYSTSTATTRVNYFYVYVMSPTKIENRSWLFVLGPVWTAAGRDCHRFAPQKQNENKQTKTENFGTWKLACSIHVFIVVCCIIILLRYIEILHCLENERTPKTCYLQNDSSLLRNIHFELVFHRSVTYYSTIGFFFIRKCFALFIMFILIY